MQLTDLPNDLFLLITAHLSPQDLILNRRVSKDFHAAFTNLDLGRQVLLQHYPRVRELHLNDKKISKSSINWADVFAEVAARYHYLALGTPRAFETLSLARSFILPEWCKNYPIAPWQRHLRFEESTASFQYPDTLWAYDEGLLIYPSTELKQYALYDLEARTKVEIDINSENKVVRRISLKERLLLVEWCEQRPYHQLNEHETVYRHFATAFDVVQVQESCTWSVVFRNEWKIHFLGLPLNSRDRFFSTHNASHYAMYLWQPNRSAWGEYEPIEALAVWDISSPSLYRPSEDPTGSHKPDDTIEGPKVTMRLSVSDLDFYQIRQRDLPAFMELRLNENNVYLTTEDHRWLAGDQASDMLPLQHEVKTTGIPFTGGPRWENFCDMEGDDKLSYCQRSSEARDPYLAPCWRHEEFPYLTITEAVDARAGVTFSARQCFTMETISTSIRTKRDEATQELLLSDEFWVQLLAKGKICGDERWLIGENDANEVVILYFDRDASAQSAAHV